MRRLWDAHQPVPAQQDGQEGGGEGGAGADWDLGWECVAL